MDVFINCHIFVFLNSLTLNFRDVVDYNGLDVRLTPPAQWVGCKISGDTEIGIKTKENVALLSPGPRAELRWTTSLQTLPCVSVLRSIWGGKTCHRIFPLLIPEIVKIRQNLVIC